VRNPVKTVNALPGEKDASEFCDTSRGKQLTHMLDKEKKYPSDWCLI